MRPARTYRAGSQGRPGRGNAGRRFIFARLGARFIFVGGGAALGHHAGGPEHALDCHPEYPRGAGVFATSSLSSSSATGRRLGIDRGAIEAFASAPEVDRLTAQLIEDLLLPLADRHGAPYLSEKTPSNALVFRELLDIFPAVRCIFVLRDPRAIIASMLEVGARAAARGTPPNPGRVASRPPSPTCSAISGRRATPRPRRPGRVLVLRYETLVTEPEAVTRAICGFLGLPWTAIMLTPSSLQHPGEQAINRTAIWYDPASFRRDPDPTGIDKWKERLSARQKAVITLAFAGMPEVSWAGYPLRHGESTPPEYALGLGARTRRAPRRAPAAGAGLVGDLARPR